MNDKVKTATPFGDLASVIEGEIVQLALPAVQNIKTAFDTIAANKGNATVLIAQEAVIISNINTLILQAPALLPVLQSNAITAGAVQASDLLAQLIAAMEGLIPSSAAKAEKGAESEK